jgi:hypothetical protein
MTIDDHADWIEVLQVPGPDPALTQGPGLVRTVRVVHSYQSQPGRASRYGQMRRTGHRLSQVGTHPGKPAEFGMPAPRRPR